MHNIIENNACNKVFLACLNIYLGSVEPILSLIYAIL
jgi:hypothetical protein